MAKENKDTKIKELKIEFLKQKSKRKDIKKEIARLLTLKPQAENASGGKKK
jgi:ribosomal protein L29